MKAKAYFEAIGRSESARGIPSGINAGYRRDYWSHRWMHEAYNRGYVNQLWRKGERSGDPRPRKPRPAPPQSRQNLSGACHVEPAK
jgi:hypothetical protein